MTELSARDISAIKKQRTIGQINAWWFVFFNLLFLRFIMRYRFRDSEALKLFQGKVASFLTGAQRSPVIICANHLTLIDSLVIDLFLRPPWRYIVGGFRHLPWNVPEIANFGHNLPMRIFSYLGKCIYIGREGPIAAKRKTLEKLKWLLKQGEIILIFPEGGRSRKGKVDMANVTYGVGELVQAVPSARVLCIYQRGMNQETWSDFPKRKQKFFLDMSCLDIDTDPAQGRRGARAIAVAIMDRLKAMEDSFYADRQ